MSILTQGLRLLCRKAAATCLPNTCLLCGSDSEAVVCSSCQADLPLLPPARCPRCAEPNARGEHCGSCIGRPPHFDRATAAYRYDFPLDRLIHGLKYGGQLALADWFGHQMASTLAGERADRLIPLPLHPLRLQERGFNQSGEIARIVGRELAIPIDLDSCRRTRPTSPQAALPISERAANIRGAFECVNDLTEQRILLVDDVMTSGATLNECARVLKLHGAAWVGVAVIARALRN